MLLLDILLHHYQFCCIQVLIQSKPKFDSIIFNFEELYVSYTVLSLDRICAKYCAPSAVILFLVRIR